MMLESEVRGVIAKSEQEVVVVVMTRTVECAGLGNQIFEVLNGLRLRFESGSAVSGDVQGVLQIAVEIKFFEILTGEYRGIDQRRQRDGCELKRLAGSAAFKRGAVLPPGRKLQARRNGDLVARPSLRINQHCVPTHQGELFGGRGASGKLSFRGREEIERDVKRVHALRNIDIDGEHLGGVAMPSELFTPGRELGA